MTHLYRTRDGRRGPRGAGRPGRMPTPAHTSKPTTQSGLVPLYASVDPDVKAALLTIAERKRVPMVDVLREALLGYIANERVAS